MAVAVLTGLEYGEQREHTHVTQTLHSPHTVVRYWLNANTAKQAAPQKGITVLLTACKVGLLFG
jgi:hypothetical protein